MAFEVRIPSLGESVSEGVIARWAREDGETVSADDVLLELETDKASMEIPAERSGVLHIVRAAGETVAVGEVVATIDEAGAPAAKAG
ncbi:MAG TPA: biotin/lipoyl-containing protein, partial [Candidatus Limnocylindria bacterium]|nr:biotin/lipoyl-containing protein [Candidatus Limnocylindria bacterium]